MPLSYGTNDIDIGSPGGSTPLSKAVAIWIAKPGFSFATQAAAAVKATVQAAVAAGNLMPLLHIDSEEIKDSETNKTETDTGRVIKNWEGLRKRIYTFTNSLDTHKKMRTFNGSDFSAYLCDMNGQLMGTSSDGILFEPFTLSYLDVAQQNWGAGFTTKVEVVFADSTEWDSRGSFFTPPYPLSAITPVYPCTIVTQSTVSATIFTVAVAYVSTSEGDNAGVKRSVPIIGLAKENFVCHNMAAPTVALTPSSAVESTTVPGTYVVTCATFTGGPCAITPTATNLYKSPAVTIVAA